MSPRFLVPMFLIALAATSAAAQPAAPARGQDPARILPALPLVPVTLSSLFEVSRDVVTTSQGTVIATPTPDVLVARVEPDGSVVTACVASADAAAKFLAKNREVDAQSKPQEK